MKRVAQIGFIYGCITSVASLLWYCAAVAGHVMLPGGPSVMASILIIHGIAMTIMLYRPPLRRPWLPVLGISPVRLRVARTLLICATANFLFCATLALREGDRVSVRQLAVVLSSMALLNTVYVVVHWAFRPANLFPRQLVSSVSNSFSFFRHRRKPLDDEIQKWDKDIK